MDAALVRVHNTEERLYEAEMYRLRGELLLRGGKSAKTNGYHSQTSAAETRFQQAIAIARHQQAKSLELRAVLSLC